MKGRWGHQLSDVYDFDFDFDFDSDFDLFLDLDLDLAWLCSIFEGGMKERKEILEN